LDASSSSSSTTSPKNFIWLSFIFMPEHSDENLMEAPSSVFHLSTQVTRWVSGRISHHQEQKSAENMYHLLVPSMMAININ
jgi:hypothetical protein